MSASQRFRRSMIPVRSIEQLSCLTRRVTEAERSSSVENANHACWFSILGTVRSPGDPCRGCRADGIAPSSCICLTIHGYPYQGGAERCHANQDTVFHQVWSVRVYLTRQVLQKLTVIDRSYSRTTRYPVCVITPLNRTRKSSFVSRSTGPSWILSVSGNFRLSIHCTEISIQARNPG